MYEDLYVVNGKVSILTSLLGGEQPSAEVCDVTMEDFIKICEELDNDGLIRNANFGNTFNAEITDKGKNYVDTVVNKLSE